MCLPGTVEAVRARDEAEGPRVDRRAVLMGAAGAALAAAFPASALANGHGHGHGNGSHRRAQDLTHTFRAGFPIYGNPPVFNPPSRRTLVNIVPDGFYAQEWTFGEHSGTHMDAPGHFITGGRFTPDITPAELMLPLFVVDIRRKAAADPDAMVSVDDIRRAERKHGHVRRGSLVAMDSGWDKRAGSEAAFRNPDSAGVYHFPGFSNDAVEWLIDERQSRRGRRGHAQPRSGELDDLRRALHAARVEPIRARGPGEPRQGEAERRDGIRRRRPVGARLRRPGARLGGLVADGEGPAARRPLPAHL